MVKEKMGQRVALMGNIAPLDLRVRGDPVEIYNAALACLEKAAAGGGVSPRTRP